jgi:hypothetical protein
LADEVSEEQFRRHFGWPGFGWSVGGLRILGAVEPPFRRRPLTTLKEKRIEIGAKVVATSP